MFTTRAKRKPEHSADKPKNDNNGGSTQPMTQPGDGLEQSNFGANHYVGRVVFGKSLLPEIPLITSMETPLTIPKEISKRSAKNATTKKQQAKQDLEALMQKHGIKWGKHNGKRVLYFPCSASEDGRRAVIEAIRSQ